jgi:hypothetical protein
MHVQRLPRWLQYLSRHFFPLSSCPNSSRNATETSVHLFVPNLPWLVMSYGNRISNLRYARGTILRAHAKLIQMCTRAQTALSMRAHELRGRGCATQEQAQQTCAHALKCTHTPPRASQRVPYLSTSVLIASSSGLASSSSYLLDFGMFSVRITCIHHHTHCRLSSG